MKKKIERIARKYKMKMKGVEKRGSSIKSIIQRVIHLKMINVGKKIV